MAIVLVSIVLLQPSSSRIAGRLYIGYALCEFMDVSPKMEDLKQEIHDLKQRLQLAQQMERAYLDEIEQLKDSLHSMSVSRPQFRTGSPEPSNDTCLVEQLEQRVLCAEQEVTRLTEQLRLSKQQQIHLEERLETLTSEPSISSFDLNQSDRTQLVEEVARLKEELDSMEASSRVERSKLERRLAESEEERASLQSDVSELERHLKDLRNELTDTRAQLQAVELQANHSTDTRGNSVFSEVEDRRIRAEGLVQRQSQLIENLRAELKRTQAEAKRKLTEEVQKLEIRFRDRDTKFTDNLVAERTRLLADNRTLTLQLQQTEELQLDNERRAMKLSKAFNFHGDGQEPLISMLERRITTLQRRLNEKTSLVDGLRERVLKANLLRRQMQTELWSQMDTNTRLSEQLARYQQQKLVCNTSCNLEQTKQGNAGVSAQPVADRATTSVSLAGELVQTAHDENTNPCGEHAQSLSKKAEESKITKAKQVAVDLNHLEMNSGQTSETELPSNCKAS
ncbi:Tropomyosin [Paragonimus skrjabini miyazakii]|uniref:Tropomyosin n=1 Tax=Paragonimus skrjabini miyazakii TaxID=59628 RepID=A0A8S9YSU3_9TREM|nr:Tropomyosin [Paragonimus skrjabini miyazakii]